MAASRSWVTSSDGHLANSKLPLPERFCIASGASTFVAARQVQICWPSDNVLFFSRSRYSGGGPFAPYFHVAPTNKRKGDFLRQDSLTIEDRQGAGSTAAVGPGAMHGELNATCWDPRTRRLYRAALMTPAARSTSPRAAPSSVGVSFTTGRMFGSDIRNKTVSG